MKKLTLSFVIALSTGSSLFNCKAASAWETKRDIEPTSIVASCTNKEATYQFHANEDDEIQFATLARYSPSVYKMNCKPSRAKGELIVCSNELYSRGDELVLYRDGYAIMHFNTDSDSNNDGDKARCKGSYFGSSKRNPSSWSGPATADTSISNRPVRNGGSPVYGPIAPVTVHNDNDDAKPLTGNHSISERPVRGGGSQMGAIAWDQEQLQCAEFDRVRKNFVLRYVDNCLCVKKVGVEIRFDLREGQDAVYIPETNLQIGLPEDLRSCE